jgi:hypothetical protein
MRVLRKEKLQLIKKEKEPKHISNHKKWWTITSLKKMKTALT